MILILAYFCCSWLLPLALGSSCDLKHFEALIKGLKYDSHSLDECQKIITKLGDCQNESPSGQQLLDQLYYRSGIIQLSLNQDLKAIDSFEHVHEGDGSFGQLARNRLDHLYVEYGLWDRVDPKDEVRQRFQTLNGTVHSKWYANHDVSQIDDELQEMLRLSPYSLDLRTFHLELLLNKLAEEMDVSTAHEAIRNYELLLDKYGTKFTLEKRLSLHYYISIIQTFIINTEPSHLRKCLALDMDFEPCRKLTLLTNKLNKINPSRSQILDPEVYAFEENTEVNWERAIQFYLVDKKPCARLPKGYKFQNNYHLIMHIASSSIGELISKTRIKHEHVSSNSVTDFHRFIHMILCQASANSQSVTPTARSFCNKAMDEILSKETRKDFQRIINQNQKGLEDILTSVWNSYPHLAIHMIQNIISHPKKVSNNVQDQLYKFFQDNHLARSKNKLIHLQYRTITSLVKERQQHQQRQQQQHHQQQQQWFFNQNHQHQQSRREAPPPNSPRSDKDYYKILEVPRSASTKDIRKAYLDFTKRYHPDKQGQISEDEQNKIHEKMSEINEAYETLGDEEKRKEYDLARSSGSLRNGQVHPNMFRQQPRGGPSQFGKNFKMNFKPNFGFRT